MGITDARYVVTPEQTGMVISYKNRELVADLAMPMKKLLSNKTAFTYLVRNLEDGFTVPDTKVGRKSQPNSVSFKVTQGSGNCEAHGLTDSVPQEDIDNADGNVGDLVTDSLEGTMDLVLLGREKRVAEIVANPDNYLTNKVHTLAAGEKIDNPESNPIEYLLEMLEDAIVRPNRMIVNQRVWTKLRMHPKVVKAVHGNAGDSGVATRQAVAELLEIQEIIVGSAFINEVKKGATPKMIRCWSDMIALHYYEPTANINRGLAWGLSVQSGDRYAETVWNPKIGLKGGYDVTVGAYWDEIVMAKGAGMLLRGVIA